MIREEKIEFTTKWCKYSKYVIEKKDDKYYILPDKNAKPSTYDPFEIKNQILKDLLVIGKESVDNEMFKLGNKEVSIEALSKIEKFQKLVLEFVNNYGLLGNFRFLPESYEFMDNGELPVNLGYNTSINALDFEKKYCRKGICFMESLLYYSPVIIVVVVFLVQQRIVVTPEQLERKHREILSDIENRFVSIHSYEDLKSQFSEIKDKIDKIYDCLILK